MTRYEITHTTSSPYCPQSNGKAENAVKLAEKILLKAEESGRDPYLALLELRNTPTQGLDTSPCQRLMGRRSRTLLPVPTNALKPKTPRNVVKRLQERKTRQQKYYDRHTKPLRSLDVGEKVRFRKMAGQWELGQIKERYRPRSYIVETGNGRLFGRNRRHIRPFQTTDFNPYSDGDLRDLEVPESDHRSRYEIADPEPEAQLADIPITPPPCANSRMTRSGRMVKEPTHDDFVYYKP